MGLYRLLLSALVVLPLLDKPSSEVSAVTLRLRLMGARSGGSWRRCSRSEAFVGGEEASGEDLVGEVFLVAL